MTQLREIVGHEVPARRHRGAWRLHSLVLLAVGASSGAQLMGITVTGASIVCLLLAPAFLLQWHRGADLVPLLAAVLAGLAYWISGSLNGVGPGWPNAVAPAAFVLYLVGFTVLTGRSVTAIATLLGGLGLGSTIFFLTQGIGLTQVGGFAFLWKYGIAHGVTVVLVFALIAVFPDRWMLPVLVLAVLGLTSLFLNFRSHALVCVAVGTLLVARRVLAARKGKKWWFGAVLAVGLLFAEGMPAVARTGVLGAALQAKTITQSDTGLPLLLAGRTELPMSLTAIAERPLIGWGSAAQLPPSVYTEAEHLAFAIGYPNTFAFEDYWRLPVFDYSAFHSILFGSWAEGGIAAAGWAFGLLFVAVAVVWNFDRFGRWAPLVLLVGLQGIWDLFFSPWTYNMIPEFACVVLLFGAVHGKRSRVRPADGDLRLGAPG